MPVRVFTSRSQSYAASTARSQIAANAKNPNVSLHHTLSLPIDGEDRKREEKERERERKKTRKGEKHGETAQLKETWLGSWEPNPEMQDRTLKRHGAPQLGPALAL